MQTACFLDDTYCAFRSHVDFGRNCPKLKCCHVLSLIAAVLMAHHPKQHGGRVGHGSESSLSEESSSTEWVLRRRLADIQRNAN